jgi:NAD(P)-dependent dehydrogenase (short-subunit alcohol dehydrogenase family)
MVATMSPYLVASIQEQMPMHRMGQAHELKLARVVYFLAQSASSQITEQSWGVNGGIET